MSTTVTAAELITLQPVGRIATNYNPARIRNSSGDFSNALPRSLFNGHPVDDELSVPLQAQQPNSPSKFRLTLTILQPSLVNFLSSFTTGIIGVGLPSIAYSLSLPRSLYLWPSSVYGLTSGSMLLVAGSMADLLGARRLELAGILLMGAFTLACGLSATGIQLVVFRALQGLALAIHLPASVALVAAGTPEGKARNIGFACLGLSQPLGWSAGLVASGIMIERVGWRMGFYVCGAAMLVLAIAARWMLPNVKPEREAVNGRSLMKMLYTKIDWLGALLASGGLALLSTVLAFLSADLSTIHSPKAISMFSSSLALLASFPVWMHYREKAGKPALVPNSLWKNVPFASTCAMVMLSFGALNAMEVFTSLYFQEIQNVSTLTTSLYLMPNMIVGVMINLSVGLFVHRIPARWLVALSSILCAAAPLIMARVSPKSSYWVLEFWSQVLTPFSGDVLFTVGLIIVSDNFPKETQALAGAIFSTVSQFGQSLGICVCQVVALSVVQSVDSGQIQNGTTEGVEDAGNSALLKGYRASFWTMFAYMVACGFIAIVGLRKAGKVGLKQE